jgi:hypothetical protein
MAHFTKTPEGWRHETHDGIQQESQRLAQKQQRYRQRSNSDGNVTGNVTSDVTDNVTGDVTRSPSPSPSPSPDQTQTPKKEKISERTERAPHLDSVEAGAGFSAFWAAYPRKVGKDAAFRAFQKHAPTAALVETMLRALTRQRQTVQWRKDDGQFIPHPATWLNQGRWQDEPDAPVSTLASVPNSNGRNCPHDQPCPSAGFCYRRRQFDQAVADGSITQTEADNFLAKLRATA